MDDLTTPETEVIVEQDAPEEEPTDEVEIEDSGEEGEIEVNEEEVDFEGKRYNLPKELKDALLRQSDYTRKTQEVAEQRRQAEALVVEVEQTRELHSQTLEQQAYLIAIDQQLKQFNELDWNSVIDDDPVGALKLQQQFQGLNGMRNQVLGNITQAQQEHFRMQQESFAKQMETSNAELARDIPGWSYDLATSLRKYSMEKGNLSSDDISNAVRNPKVVKLLHKAYMYDQLVAKQQPKQKIAEPVKPVTTIKAKSSGAIKSPDKMTDIEFAKWRKGQIQKRS